MTGKRLPVVLLAFMAALTCLAGQMIDAAAWMVQLTSSVVLFTADGAPLSGAWS